MEASVIKFVFPSTVEEACIENLLLGILSASTCQCIPRVSVLDETVDIHITGRISKIEITVESDGYDVKFMMLCAIVSLSSASPLHSVDISV